MGCTTSKLDDLPAVVLCHDRCTFLDEAIHYRYALAEAHLAYIHSLKTVGLSLHHFFHQSPDISNPTPQLHSPAKTEPPKNQDCQSNPSSHLHFHSDSDENENNPTSHFHHQGLDISDSAPQLQPPVKTDPQKNQDCHSSPSSHLHFPDSDENENNPTTPLHQYSHFTYANQESLDPGPYQHYPYYGGDFMHMNFMRNQITPSVTYEQMPMSTQTVHMSESNFYNYEGEFFASTMPRTYGIAPEVGPGPVKPVPAPPSPPRSSPWEFLNPFENYERNYSSYATSRDSREVREEEGIPDLESEDFENEAVKEVHVDQKCVEHENEREKAAESEVKGASQELNRSRASSSTESDPVEYEVHVVDKNVVDEREKKGNVTGFKSDSDVLKEIQVQFERASVSGNELAKVLEVGKLPHNRKHATYQVSSKMLHAISPSVSIASPLSKNAAIEIADPAVSPIEEDISSRHLNISSTLQKIYLWEKKLYEEVKAEEKIRVLHERKSRKLKQLDERGAEAQKVDMTRKLVRSLSTKIRIAIQVVDKVSVKINELRDEELWPQLKELIQGLSRMWKCMLECHRHQSLAIREAKRLDAITSQKQFSDANLEATLQLEHELLNWTLRFSCWVSAQKGYVRALNNWLMKCLLYVPEETADGMAPFSPGRIGAPPIFIICNHWAQAFERVSEKEVIDCMRDFAENVLRLWERDKVELRQRMMVNKDMERQVKNLEKEDQKIQKGIHALDKRIVLVSGEENGLSLNRHVVYQSETSKNSSLQVGLQRIFDAMERFTGDTLKVYEELLQRIEEDKLARENEAVS